MISFNAVGLTLSSVGTIKTYVDACGNVGLYTPTMLKKAKNNPDIENFVGLEFDSANNICQYVYEELYPRNYDENASIRKKLGDRK